MLAVGVAVTVIVVVSVPVHKPFSGLNVTV
jgi:hypothetical protein